MFYRQPKYYGEFQCIGGDCSDNCCYGWRIDWTKEEVDKVKSAPNISPELKELVERSFIQRRNDENKYVVKFDERGKCPCVTEEGLCSIQKELGAEYLSKTCMEYPRDCMYVKGVLHALCCSSCREIIKKLLNDEKSMELMNVSVRPGSNIPIKKVIDEDSIEKKPGLKYHNEILDFYYELISYKKIPVENAIILGALAAQKLNEIVEKNKFDMIPEALKVFRKQFHDNEQLKAIENIKPNYSLKFGFLSKIVEEVVGSGATNLLHDETGAIDIDLYNKGEECLRETLKEREYFMRNLALNLLLEFDIRFCNDDKTVFDKYSLFTMAYGMIKLNLIAVCSTDKSITKRTHGQRFVYFGDDRLIGMTAIICRNICQGDEIARKIVKLLNYNRFTTPAYLALLIK